MSNFIVRYVHESIVKLAIEQNLSISTVFEDGLLDEFIQEVELELNCTFCSPVTNHHEMKLLFKRNRGMKL